MRPLIFVCQVFYPDTQSTSQLFSDLLEQAAARGQSITVLSGYPGQGGAQRLAISEMWRGIRIVRGGAGGGFKRSMVRRMLAYVTYLNFVFWRVLFAPAGSRVFVVTNPPFAPLVVWVACMLRRRSWIVMLLDIFPDGLIALEQLKPGGTIDRIWSWANGCAFGAADQVWVLGRDMRMLVAERYRVTPDRIRYVPHWSSVEFSAVITVEQTRLFRELGLERKFVVQYSGNMGLWHDLQSVVRAAELLREDDRIIFLLIGEGRERAPAERLARELGLTNVRWLPYQPKAALEDSLSCCHVALISQRAGLEGVAVPCKLYGILASGRAVVAQVPAASEVALVVAEEGCGRVVAPGDAQALADAIAELADDPVAVARMGQRSREAYLAKYTIEAGTRAFEAGFKEW